MYRLRRLLRSQPALAWLLALPFALAGLLAGSWLHDLRAARELRRGVAELQRAIESYAARTNGSYPRSLSDPAFVATFAWPVNPYGGGRMRSLAPGETPRAGDVVYVPVGPVVVYEQPPPPWLRQTRSDWSDSTFLEFDSYALYVYGQPSRLLPSKRRVVEAMLAAEKRLGPNESFTANPRLPLDWDNVVLIRTSGEDLSP